MNALPSYQRKIRASNLELLRIISMMLVMLVHYLPLRMPVSHDMAINSPLKALFDLELHSIAIICVNSFILISGYFGIKWKFKTLMGLLFQIIFWFFAGYFVAAILDPYISGNQDIPDFKGMIFSLLHWLQGRWFISAYITLYIISPLINSFVEKSSDKQLLRYIIAFYIFSTVYGYFMGSEEFATGLSALSLFGLYLIGAWLRKSRLSFIHWNKNYDLLGFVACTLILTVISYILILINFNHSIYGYLNPLVIVESIFLFQYFRKLQLGYIPWINFIAVGAFSVFLFHCHPYVAYYCKILWKYCHNTCDFAIILVLILIVAIYLFCILIDRIQQLIYKLICKLVSRISSRIHNTKDISTNPASQQ